MDAYVSVLLAAVAAASMAILPFALRNRAATPQARDSQWRDRLPLALALLRPLIRWYATGVDSALAEQKRGVLQAQLECAGASYWITPAELIVLRRLAFVIGAGMSVYVVCVLRLDQPLNLAFVLMLAPLAWLYPSVWLRDSAARRQRLFAKDFPFFLDVLVLGMRAGLTFAAAVEQSIVQLREGPVRTEFARYLREIRSGVTRRTALERVASRVTIPAVTNFAASVMQAEDTGGSLGDVLADQARQRRQERFLRAEKLANQAPVKMLLPLIALLFPVTFIIIAFPIVMQLWEAGVLGMLH